MHVKQTIWLMEHKCNEINIFIRQWVVRWFYESWEGYIMDNVYNSIKMFMSKNIHQFPFA